MLPNYDRPQRDIPFRSGWDKQPGGGEAVDRGGLAPASQENFGFPFFSIVFQARSPAKFDFQARGFICTDPELWRPISDRFHADSHDDRARVTRESHASLTRVAASRAHHDTSS